MSAEDAAALLGLSQAAIWTATAVFLRVGAMMALLPVLGEATIPARVRLALGLALTLVVAPAVADRLPPRPDGPGALALLALAEAATGLVLGFALRLLVMALQMAATIAAQATSLSQMFGGAPGTEPSPAMGHLLVAAALALATLMGLHVRLAELAIASYDLIPAGVGPAPGALLEAGLGRIAAATALAFGLAAPFVAAALLVNLLMGVMGRAMPQLMLSLIGAPGLALGSLLLLLAAAPLLLGAWAAAFGAALDAPLGPGS